MHDTRANIEYEWAIVRPVPSWEDAAPRGHVLKDENPPPLWGYLVLTLTVAVALFGAWIFFTN